jgi:hypothetical protein
MKSKKKIACDVGVSRRQFLRTAGAGAASFALAAAGCSLFEKGAGERPAGSSQADGSPKPPLISNEPSDKWRFGGHRADWLYQAKWGVMFHYVYSIRMDNPSHEKWDQRIKAFDVNGLADQLASVGAGYFLLSLAQGPPPNSPNSVYDKYAANMPKPRSMTRDLIADASAALARKGISLMVYSPGGAPGVVAPEGKFFPDWWPDALREYSRRWGKGVRGWWFDGFSKPEERNRILSEAVRSGNPDALCAFNRPHGFRRNSIYEDYTSGDTPHVPDSECKGRFVDNCQWHMLSFLAFLWGHCVRKTDVPRYPTEFVAETTRKLVSAGGVVTWDVPALASGLVPEAYMEQLAAIGRQLKGIKRS